MKRTSKVEDVVSIALPEFLLEEFLPYRLSVAANRVSRMFAERYLSASELTVPEWRVLTVVGRSGTISPSAVGELAMMDKVKVSRAAANLVMRGLVKQAQDPHDGRGRLLSLTRTGAGLHSKVVPLAKELESALAEGLNKQEWTVLNKALVKLTKHVVKIDGRNVETVAGSL